MTFIPFNEENRLHVFYTDPLQLTAAVSESCCNMKYPLPPQKSHLKLKSSKITFAFSVFLSFPIILKICTEHGSDIVVQCANF